MLRITGVCYVRNSHRYVSEYKSIETRTENTLRPPTLLSSCQMRILYGGIVTRQFEEQLSVKLISKQWNASAVEAVSCLRSRNLDEVCGGLAQ